MRRVPIILRAPLYALVLWLAATACSAFQGAEQDEGLQSHVRRIEQAIALRSVGVIRDYLHSKKTYVDILGKPASYLSVNQAIAVIESFLRQHALTGYATDLVKEQESTGIAIGTMRARSGTGTRSLKITLGFAKETDSRWHINRIMIQ